MKEDVKKKMLSMVFFAASFAFRGQFVCSRQTGNNPANGELFINEFDPQIARVDVLAARCGAGQRC